MCWEASGFAEHDACRAACVSRVERSGLALCAAHVTIVQRSKVRFHLLGASDLLGLAACVVLRCLRVLWEWALGRFASRKPIHGLVCKVCLCRGACAEKMPGRAVRMLLLWGCGVLLACA